MPTEAAVLEALRPVEDPELHQSIVDLDMVKEVAIDKPGGRDRRPHRGGLPAEARDHPASARPSSPSTASSRSTWT